MKVLPITTRVFKENEDLFSFVYAHVRKLKEGSILAVTSKIVALSEGRIAVVRNKEEREKLIRFESEWSHKSKYITLAMKDGMLMANAGIDSSNAMGKLVLLPKDSFSSAELLRRKLCAHYKIKNLGVIITDSRCFPLRAGVVGVSLGHAGFRGMKDYRGMPDIFGRKMKITQVNVADSLAASAVFAMGEGSERRPLAIIRDAPVEFCEKVNQKELQIEMKDDMYSPLFKKNLRGMK